MTLFKYLALGIGSAGLIYSLWIKKPEYQISCPQLHTVKKKLELDLEAATPKRIWMGSPFGTVVVDSGENILRYERLEETLSRLNLEYIYRCE